MQWRKPEALTAFSRVGSIQIEHIIDMEHRSWNGWEARWKNYGDTLKFVAMNQRKQESKISTD